MRYAPLLLFMVLTCVGCHARTRDAGLLEPQAAQRALIRYMDSHPDCFAGFTPSLRRAVGRVILSSDGRTAYVGSIAVDRREHTYTFQHWTENPEGRSAVNLIWKGGFVTTRDGGLQATAPSLTQEEWTRDK